MSIATAISNAQTKVAAAYTALNTKGATMPSVQNLANMPTAINSIPSDGGGGITTNIIQDNVFSFVPGGAFTGGTSGVAFPIINGHTYHIIFKLRALPTGLNVISLFVYKTSSNDPNIALIIVRAGGNKINEITYTHEQEDYAYIGVYSQSAHRSATYNCTVFIEDVT